VRHGPVQQQGGCPLFARAAAPVRCSAAAGLLPATAGCVRPAGGAQPQSQSEPSAFWPCGRGISSDQIAKGVAASGGASQLTSIENKTAAAATPSLRLPHLEGDPVPPKLFLAPAKDGGAPPDDGRVGGAVAPSASSPSKLAGGRRMGRRQSRGRERAAYLL
jgi:hypothetical protein